MTDHRALLQDIKMELWEEQGRWVRRQMDNAQFEDCLLHHFARLDELQNAQCENWDAFIDMIPDSEPITNSDEISSPGR